MQADPHQQYSCYACRVIHTSDWVAIGKDSSAAAKISRLVIGVQQLHLPGKHSIGKVVGMVL
jgi:hypothetical protein